MIVVPIVPFNDPNNYMHRAKRASGYYTDQFHNPANFDVHFNLTGPEIIRQVPSLDAVVMGCGTGGTLAGVSAYLTQFGIRCYLADPQGLQNEFCAFSLSYAQAVDYTRM